MLDYLSWIIWIVGAITCATALVLGLAEIGIWFANRMLVTFRVWPEFVRALRVMYRERHESKKD